MLSRGTEGNPGRGYSCPWLPVFHWLSLILAIWQVLLQTGPGLTSCIDQVESKGWPLNPHGPLSTWMVWSVSRQVSRWGCVAWLEPIAAMLEGELTVFHWGSWAFFGLLARNPDASTVLADTHGRYLSSLGGVSAFWVDLSSPLGRVSILLGRSFWYSRKVVASGSLFFALFCLQYF